MTENLTEQDKFLNTYSNYAWLRGVSVLACLFSLIYFPKEENKFFYSYYNWIMNREIFHSEDGFWKQMNTFMVLTYGAAMAVLLLNAIPVTKERREGAYADIAIYGYLTLLNPIYVLVSMIGSRSSRFYTDVKITILVLPFIYFLSMFVLHIKLYRKNKEGFYDRKTDSLKISGFSIFTSFLVAVLILIPVKNIISAINMSIEYSSNYGSFKAKPGEIEGIDEDTIGNRYSRSFIWDDVLYLESGSKIYKVDDTGEIVLKCDTGIENSINRFYTNETGAYLIMGQLLKDEEAEGKKTFNVYMFDLQTEESSLIYTYDFVSKFHMIDVFAVKDDYLYYELLSDAHDYTIYRIRIPKGSGEKASEPEMYVTDISILDAQDLAFVYNYDVFENIHIFSSSEAQPYKGALYYTRRLNGELGDPIDHYYNLMRSDYDGLSDKSESKIKDLADNAQYINIYKDRIYFADNVDYYEENDDGDEKSYVAKARLCSMNLDGSDLQVLAEYEDNEKYINIGDIRVSDDYIVYSLFDDGCEWKVIKR
ncbi:hypothetical protein SAMN02910369_00639 [Lachnospiraceae bacterium NE2001]|nr:hypothetical protein SAMN02910369_00639 [Lachnospiraceae bacterium NE2001]